MKISVCIAAYNGERFIKAQLDSIILQLSNKDEIIISDDGSTDNTLKIISTYSDPRVKLFHNHPNESGCFVKKKSYLIARNFENAFKYVTGDLIFLSDQDDIWIDGKVKKLTEELVNYDMIVTDHCLIDEADNIIEPSYFLRVPSGKGIIKNLKKNSYHGCCMAFKKQILSIALPFPKDIPMHDMWLGFVADLFFKVNFINIPFTKYRKHTNNTSSATNPKSEYSILKRISFRLNIVKYLPMLFVRKFTIQNKRRINYQ